MLHYAAAFFIIAIVAVLFGFGGMTASATSLAKILFVVFLVCAATSLVLGALARRN